MKNILIIAVAIALLANACTQSPNAQQAQTGEAKDTAKTTGTASAKIDVATSSIKWTGTKVTGRHEGTVAIESGSLKMEADKITGGEFTINLASIAITDLKDDMKEKLAGHLKSPDFFDVAKLAQAKFVITSITEAKTDSTTHNVEGNLTIRDVTKSIKFGAKLDTANPKQPKAYANFNINRKDWGIKYEGKKNDLIRDEINFRIDIKTTAQ